MLTAETEDESEGRRMAHEISDGHKGHGYDKTPAGAADIPSDHSAWRHANWRPCPFRVHITVVTAAMGVKRQQGVPWTTPGRNHRPTDQEDHELRTHAKNLLKTTKQWKKATGEGGLPPLGRFILFPEAVTSLATRMRDSDMLVELQRITKSTNGRRWARVRLRASALRWARAHAKPHRKVTLQRSTTGHFTRRLDSAFPGPQTKMRYDCLNREKVLILAQLRTGHASLNGFIVLANVIAICASVASSAKRSSTSYFDSHGGTNSGASFWSLTVDVRRDKRT